ncbi:MAG: hypothetical protein PVI75_07430 [Gammaproteobacteria bacterium]|jgi:hypothetical protein
MMQNTNNNKKELREKFWEIPDEIFTHNIARYDPKILLRLALVCETSFKMEFKNRFENLLKLFPYFHPELLPPHALTYFMCLNLISNTNTLDYKRLSYKNFQKKLKLLKPIPYALINVLCTIENLQTEHKKNTNKNNRKNITETAKSKLKFLINLLKEKSPILAQYLCNYINNKLSYLDFTIKIPINFKLNQRLIVYPFEIAVLPIISQKEIFINYLKITDPKLIEYLFNKKPEDFNESNRFKYKNLTTIKHDRFIFYLKQLATHFSKKQLLKVIEYFIQNFTDEEECNEELMVYCGHKNIHVINELFPLITGIIYCAVSLNKIESLTILNKLSTKIEQCIDDYTEFETNLNIPYDKERDPVRFLCKIKRTIGKQIKHKKSLAEKKKWEERNKKALKTIVKNINSIVGFSIGSGSIKKIITIIIKIENYDKSIKTIEIDTEYIITLLKTPIKNQELRKNLGLLLGFCEEQELFNKYGDEFNTIRKFEFVAKNMGLEHLCNYVKSFELDKEINELSPKIFPLEQTYLTNSVVAIYHRLTQNEQKNFLQEKIMPYIYFEDCKTICYAIIEKIAKNKKIPSKLIPAIIEILVEDTKIISPNLYAMLAKKDPHIFRIIEALAYQDKEKTITSLNTLLDKTEQNNKFPNKIKNQIIRAKVYYFLLLLMEKNLSSFNPEKIINTIKLALNEKNTYYTTTIVKIIPFLIKNGSLIDTDYQYIIGEIIRTIWDKNHENIYALYNNKINTFNKSHMFRFINAIFAERYYKLTTNILKTKPDGKNETYLDIITNHVLCMATINNRQTIDFACKYLRKLLKKQILSDEKIADIFYNLTDNMDCKTWPEGEDYDGYDALRDKLVIKCIKPIPSLTTTFALLPKKQQNELLDKIKQKNPVPFGPLFILAHFQPGETTLNQLFNKLNSTNKENKELIKFIKYILKNFCHKPLALNYIISKINTIFEISKKSTEKSFCYDLIKTLIKQLHNCDIKKSTNWRDLISKLFNLLATTTSRQSHTHLKNAIIELIKITNENYFDFFMEKITCYKDFAENLITHGFFSYHFDNEKNDKGYYKNKAISEFLLTLHAKYPKKFAKYIASKQDNLCKSLTEATIQNKP